MQPLTPTLTIAARWDRPFVAADGGESALLLHIVPPAARREADRLPVDVAFVVDRSGSMGGEAIRLAKQAVVSAIGRLTDRDRVALVVYDNEVDTLMPLSHATAGTRGALKSVLSMVDARGSTNLSGGWLQGCGLLADVVAPPTGTPGAAVTADERIHRVILLTDGHANQGITDPDELATHAQELRRRGITTTALGVGDGFDGPFLSQLAEAGGGNFAYIARPDQLADIFAAELDELVSIASRGVSLAVTVPAGAHLDLLNAYPTETGAGTTHIAVGDLPEGAEVELVAQVGFPSVAVGAVHSVAVRAMWRDADGTHHDEAIAVAPVVAAPAVEVEAKPADATVRETVALQGTARLRRYAARGAQRHDYAAVRDAQAQIGQMLMAAPMSDRIADEQAEQVAYASMPPEDMAAGDVLRMAERGFRGGRRSGRRVEPER